MSVSLEVGYSGLFESTDYEYSSQIYTRDFDPVFVISDLENFHIHIFMLILARDHEKLYPKKKKKKRNEPFFTLFMAFLRLIKFISFYVPSGANAEWSRSFVLKKPIFNAIITSVTSQVSVNNPKGTLMIAFILIYYR